MQDYKFYTIKTNSWLQIYAELKIVRYNVKRSGTDPLSNYGKLQGTPRRFGMK